MTREIHTTEGIVIQAVPFRDYDKILTLFTLDAGIIKLFCKGYKKPGKSGSISSLLSRIEVSYQEKNSELFFCEEMTLIDTYQSLRLKLPTLTAACELLRLVQISQLVGKPAPALYQLLRFFLARMPESQDTQVIVITFMLKILRHEGILANFNEELVDIEGLAFSLEERVVLEHLAYSTSFRAIFELTLPESFKEKVETLFSRLLS